MVRRVRRGLFLAVAWAAVLIGGAGQAFAANPFPPSSSWQTNGTVRVITFAGNVMYVGGQFTTVRPPGAPAGSGEVKRQNVAAFNATTGAVLKWNPGANGTVRSIATASDRVYLGGSFTSVGGRARSNLAAVSTGGTVAKWNPGANRSVFVVRLGPNGNLFVGGDFGKVGGLTRRHLAEIGRSATAPVSGWAPVDRPDHRLRLSPALLAARLHDRVLVQRQARVLRRPLRPGQRRHPQRDRRGADRRRLEGARLQPEHLRRRQLPGVHDGRDEPRLQDRADRHPHLHLRRLLEGERDEDVLQRERLRSRTPATC